MSLSVTNSLTLRIYYNRYSSVASGATRKDSTTGTLSMADSSALRNAIRRLQDYDFKEADTDDIQEKLQAFADTMNNTLTSATDYGTNDSSVKNAAKKIKNLNSEYASDLKKIGITVEKNGTLSVYESAGKNYSAERFSKFFDSDSEYLNSIYDAAKRIMRRVDIRL
ncbi:MAG: hypothetical protein K6F66_01665 [Pseudobutyrivibrio sp.]|nr:hypothetical protein [Pseudobutyrivibrio sp.]